jgi:ATP-dependent Lon protease
MARLFPLPDLVMFPHVMQPLHIFEPRYREMLNDALDGDGLIAMSILAPGWEENYEGSPRLLPQVCVGKVVTHQRLDDGRYNIMLLGMRRARLVNEVSNGRSFRQAELELVEEVCPAEGDAERAEMQSALCSEFQMALPLPPGAKSKGPVQELLAAELPLAVLTDLASFALPLDVGLKCRLLAECNVDRRAQLLLEALGAAWKGTAPSATTSVVRFPPRFSAN